MSTKVCPDISLNARLHNKAFSCVFGNFFIFYFVKSPTFCAKSDLLRFLKISHFLRQEWFTAFFYFFDDPDQWRKSPRIWGSRPHFGKRKLGVLDPSRPWRFPPLVGSIKKMKNAGNHSWSKKCKVFEKRSKSLLVKKVQGFQNVIFKKLPKTQEKALLWHLAFKEVSAHTLALLDPP